MVLIVDDSKTLRERLVAVLSEIEGITIMGEATNAVEAILAIQKLKPKVVILDIQMPGGSGIEVLKTVKQDSHPPVVIMLTNHPIRQYREKCKQLGADYFLDKTHDLDTLTDIFKGLIERFKTEEKLHESEERYRVVAETATDVIVTIDENSTILFVNKSVERVFGYTVPELLDQPITLLMPEYLREIHEAAIHRFVQTGKKHLNWESVELPGLHKSGRKIPLELSFGEFVKNGRHYFTGIARDITERKKVEDALRRSEEHFRAIFEGAGVGNVECDATTGRFLLVNQKMCEITGYSAEELLTMKFSDITHPEDRETNIAQYQQFVKKETPHYSVEKRYIRKDGTIVWVQVSSTLLCDKDGEASNTVAVIQDITKRKHAEQELSRSEERYRDLVENARDIIYCIDLAGNFTSINKAGEQLTGYTQEEAKTINMAQIVAPEYLDKARQMIARKISKDEVTIYDLVIMAKDGRPISVEVNTRLLFQDGVPIGVQGIARDITERKQLEEQLRQAQKMEAIGQLAGGIAHDFNNLLTVISGYSNLLLKSLSTEAPLRASLKEIKKASDRAAALTGQLLAFSRRQVLQPQILSLNSVVAEMGNMFQLLLGETIELHLELHPELASLKADPGQIEQVLMNLIVNARDAMPNGGKLTIETGHVYLAEEYTKHHVSVSPGHYVMLAVSDTGTGMDEPTQMRIFDPFFTTKPVGKGTGLGLSTVYGIVKQSGGHIWVYSEVGRGTTFKVYLPRIEEDAPTYKRNVETDEIAPGTETILLAEDEAMVRRLTREVLEKYGYRVLEATNGCTALSLCAQVQEPIHLLISDVVMPELGGRELAQRLTQLHPEMKVLYTSGYTDKTIVHHGILDADLSFLQKPFTPDALARKVREVLEAKP